MPQHFAVDSSACGVALAAYRRRRSCGFLDSSRVISDRRRFSAAGAPETDLAQRTGLWVGPDAFEFTIRTGALPTSNPALQEVLGWWFLPICSVIGVFVLLATTKLIQFLMKWLRWRGALAKFALTQRLVTAK
jgi:hypothetical protein